MNRDLVEKGSPRTSRSPATIKVRRLTDPRDPEDGIRVLAAFRQPSWLPHRRFDAWCRHLGPPPYVVDALIGQGQPAIEWEEFRNRYVEYLAFPQSQQAVDRYAGVLAAGRPVTLLCDCHDHAATNCPLDVVAEAISAVARTIEQQTPVDDRVLVPVATEPLGSESSVLPPHEEEDRVVVRRGIPWDLDSNNRRVSSLGGGPAVENGHGAITEAAATDSVASQPPAPTGATIVRRGMPAGVEPIVLDATADASVMEPTTTSAPRPTTRSRREQTMTTKSKDDMHKTLEQLAGTEELSPLWQKLVERLGARHDGVARAYAAFMKADGRCYDHQNTGSTFGHDGKRRFFDRWSELEAVGDRALESLRLAIRTAATPEARG